MNKKLVCLLFMLTAVLSGCSSAGYLMQNTYGQMPATPPMGQGVIAGRIIIMQSKYDRFKDKNLISSITTVFHKKNSFELFNRSSYRNDGYFAWTLSPGKYRMENLFVTLRPGFNGAGPILSSGTDMEVKANEILFLGNFNLELFNKEQMRAHNDCVFASLLRNEACFDTTSDNNSKDIKAFLAQFGYGENFTFKSVIIDTKKSIDTIEPNMVDTNIKTVFDKLKRQKSLDKNDNPDWDSLRQGMVPQKVYQILGKPKNIQVLYIKGQNIEKWVYVERSVTFKNERLDILEK